MSQTADLQHLFQLEQILSVRPNSREWSYCLDEESQQSSANTIEHGNSVNKEEDSSLEPSEQNLNSTTSFDPGGTQLKRTIEDNGSKIECSEDSDNVHVNAYLSSTKSSINSSPSLQNNREILSYSSTKCGTNIVFVALTTNNGSKSSIPQLGSIMLKPGVRKFNRYSECKDYNDSSDQDLVEDEVATDLNVSVHHIPWYDHGDSSADVLTCVTLCEEKKICLVSCRDGSLFVLPLHVVFPGYRPSSFSKSHYNEDVSTKAEDISQLFSNSSSHDIYSIPKPMYHQRADPSSLIIWSTNEITVGIIGTLQGKVVAVDVHSGKEVNCNFNIY